MRPGKPLIFGKLGDDAVARPARQSGVDAGLRDALPAARHRGDAGSDRRRRPLVTRKASRDLKAERRPPGLCARQIEITRWRALRPTFRGSGFVDAECAGPRRWADCPRAACARGRKAARRLPSCCSNKKERAEARSFLPSVVMAAVEAAATVETAAVPVMAAAEVEPEGHARAVVARSSSIRVVVWDRS